MGVCAEYQSHHCTCLWSCPPHRRIPHRGQSCLAPFGSLCLPSSPAPFLLSPEPGNFPHFHPAMMFSSLKSPSRPHPPECSARAHGRLLFLGMTTFPSRYTCTTKTWGPYIHLRGELHLTHLRE